MKIACLSCNDLSNYTTDEHLLVSELKHRGHTVETISWMADYDWETLDCVLIRTTWDYIHHSKKFMEKLELIASKTKLLNSLDVVKWNFNKRYLFELEKKGVLIVPSLLLEHSSMVNIPLDWNEIIAKPLVSNGAYLTQKISRNHVFTGGEWLIQPFLNEIYTGELSLFYFNGNYSHAVKKIPRRGSFYVQEEHGGDIRPFTPTTELIDLGKSILSKIDHSIFYARVDLVPYQGSYALMEIELIEPAIYFSKSENAARNYVDAFEIL